MAFWDDVEIVSLEQAKQHLRLPDTSEQDDDLTLKLVQAHAIVLDYIVREDTRDAMLEWDDETAPKAVQAAILRQFGDLARFRGDDEAARSDDGLDLSPRVKQLLRMYRTPALA